MLTNSSLKVAIYVTFSSYDSNTCLQAGKLLTFFVFLSSLFNSVLVFWVLCSFSLVLELHQQYITLFDRYIWAIFGFSSQFVFLFLLLARGNTLFARSQDYRRNKCFGQNCTLSFVSKNRPL